MFNPNGIEFPGEDSEARQVVPEKGLPTHDPNNNHQPKSLRDPLAEQARQQEMKRRKEERDILLKKYQTKLGEPATTKAKGELLPAPKIAAKADGERLTWDQQTEKLNAVMIQIYEKQKGWPLGKDCRIRMEDFIGAPNYDESIVTDDLREIVNYEKSAVNKTKIGGEMMEKITIALFAKFLPDIICARTAKFDDYYLYDDEKKGNRNGFDAALFINGSIATVFDMVMEDNSIGVNKEEKQKMVNDKNIKYGGGTMKYCINKEGNNISFGPAMNLPAYTLAADTAMMNRAINNFSLDGPKNDSEKCMFYYLVDSLYQQINKLEFLLRTKQIRFEDRINGKKDFEGRIKSLKSLLEKNYKWPEVSKYLEEQIEKSKGKTKSPHKRITTRIR